MKNVLTKVEKFVAAVLNKDKELLSSEINNCFALHIMHM